MSKTMTHNLEISPEYFNAVVSGEKTFEIRKNGRDFKAGDKLHLTEVSDSFPPRKVTVEVTHILDNPEYLQKGYVAMGIKILAHWVIIHEDPWADPPEINVFCSHCTEDAPCSMYSDDDALDEQKLTDKMPICPYCGAKMVVTGDE